MNIKEIFKTSLKSKIESVLIPNKNREEILEELEELLILSDISLELVGQLLANLKKKTRADFNREAFLALMQEEIKQIFSRAEGGSPPSDGRDIIMLVGINGSGKTTTAAKLGHYYHRQGKKVLFSAADTFRAAGGSQLLQWGERLGLPVIAGARGQDPGSVVYNSLESFKGKDYDTLIIDTAGRVQTRENLMKELQKIVKIIEKVFPGKNAEVWLVIDATMGQNTLDQARRFKEFSGLTGMVLAKLDGTAHGGTVLNIVNEMKVPVKFLGTGEKEKDIVPFSRDEFIASLLS